MVATISLAPGRKLPRSAASDQQRSILADHHCTRRCRPRRRATAGETTPPACHAGHAARRVPAAAGAQTAHRRHSRRGGFDSRTGVDRRAHRPACGHQRGAPAPAWHAGGAKANGVYLPWLRNCSGETAQVAPGSNTQTSATHPRPAAGRQCQRAQRVAEHAHRSLVTARSVAAAATGVQAHFSAMLSSSSSPVAPGSASPNGRFLASHRPACGPTPAHRACRRRGQAQRIAVGTLAQRWRQRIAGLKNPMSTSSGAAN